MTCCVCMRAVKLSPPSSSIQQRTAGHPFQTPYPTHTHDTYPAYTHKKANSTTAGPLFSILSPSLPTLNCIITISVMAMHVSFDTSPLLSLVRILRLGDSDKESLLSDSMSSERAKMSLFSHSTIFQLPACWREILFERNDTSFRLFQGHGSGGRSRE